MRSVAGVALIAPARGRASKKIINIMHTGAAALLLEAKVAVGKNKATKATKAIDNWKGSVQRKVLVERGPRFRCVYPVRAPERGPNRKPTPNAETWESRSALATRHRRVQPAGYSRGRPLGGSRLSLVRSGSPGA